MGARPTIRPSLHQLATEASRNAHRRGRACWIAMRASYDAIDCANTGKRRRETQRTQRPQKENPILLRVVFYAFFAVTPNRGKGAIDSTERRARSDVSLS